MVVSFMHASLGIINENNKPKEMKQTKINDRV